MKRLQAYKFEITPNGEQSRMTRKYAGHARKVWNLALDRQEKNHDAGEKFTGAKGMNDWIPEWGKGFPFLCESPAQTLQQIMENLAKGYEKFFKKKGKSADSFRFPQGFKLDQTQSRIFMPKLGWTKYRNSREILGTAKNITVSASDGKWFVSIQAEREVEQLVHPATSIVGIDVGIVRFTEPCPMVATLNHSTPSGSTSKGLHATSVSCLARRSSAATEKRRKPVSRRFISASPMLAATSCTKSYVHNQQKPRDGVY